MARNEPATNPMLRSYALSDRDFNRIRELMYDICHIDLHAGKRELVQARLSKRLRRLGIDDFNDYVKRVTDDPSGLELSFMVDMLTTNLTFFFREADHFDYLKREVLERSARGSRIRIWSAGCSSGEEAYSIAMVVRQVLGDSNWKDVMILATDISSRMLDIARAGMYRESRFRDTPVDLREKYFRRLRDKGEDVYKAREEITTLVRFNRLNLAGPWPMKGSFDVIFCRNVMIYFDKKAQVELVNRLYEFLMPQGVLMVGHSESLTGIKHDFNYVRPSVYTKP